MQEHERKFLIDPSKFYQNLSRRGIDSYRMSVILQGYLVIEDEYQFERRFRIESSADLGVEFTETEKCGSGKSRSEKERTLTLEEMNEILTTMTTKPIGKIRYLDLKAENGLKISFDIYCNIPDISCVAEVEGSLEAVDAFEVPDWFGIEVTEDKFYKNKNIWKRLNSNPN